jgi:hypothetical protein
VPDSGSSDAGNVSREAADAYAKFNERWRADIEAKSQRRTAGAQSPSEESAEVEKPEEAERE